MTGLPADAVEDWIFGRRPPLAGTDEFKRVRDAIGGSVTAFVDIGRIADMVEMDRQDERIFELFPVAGAGWTVRGAVSTFSFYLGVDY